MLELDSFYIPEPVLGFASRGPEEQWKFQFAATYSDEFVSKDGNFMRVFFVCLANTGWGVKCLTALANKVWRPKSGDWLNPHGWACADCNASYKSAWGCLCEIKAPGVPDLLYVRSEVPTQHINDARAMFYEDTLKPCSPQELYENVPQAYPSHTGIIAPVLGKPGVFRIDALDTWESIPLWNWHKIFTLVGVTLPPTPLTKKEAAAQRNAQWAEECKARLAASSSGSSLQK